MPTAALYDIRGNLPALDAVLDEISRADVDQIVVGGDAVLGPMPRETLERLLGVDLPVHFIHGNCELAQDPAARDRRTGPGTVLPRHAAQ